MGALALRRDVVAVPPATAKRLKQGGGIGKAGRFFGLHSGKHESVT
jgi:hypothetical protein